MKTLCKGTPYFVVACLCSLAATICHSQDTSIGQDRLKQLLQALRPTCERLVVQIVTQKDISLSLTAKPINSASACNCAESKFSTDARLKKFWLLSERDMKDPIQSEQVKSYMTARMITSILECLTQDMEASLQSAELPQ